MDGQHFDLSRRDFLQVAGVAAAAGLTFDAGAAAQEGAAPAPIARARKTPTVRGAFVYPPTQVLRDAGYYSWPGSGFDAEGHQRQYAERIAAIERKLGMRIAMEPSHLDGGESVGRFIEDVKASSPDGLLLIPFKKGHWPQVKRIIDETGLPTVVLATLGVLLIDQVNELHRKAGVHLISSLDDFQGVEYGMRMIRTAARMRDGLIVNIDGAEVRETTVPFLGTCVRAIPHERFYEEFRRTEAIGEVRELARRYWRRAKAVEEPTQDDVLDAARCYFALKRIVDAEQADALMMNCLPGLQQPRKHVPPCMAFMSLRDEGIPAGCQSDLNATLSLLLVQELFGRPGFQQNASVDTGRNLYFGAHCTCPSRLDGPDGPAEPYILRSHAEAGWGCVPRVLFTKDRDVTLTQYVSGDAPHMYVYTGKVADCPPIPPAGGCRTNVAMTINEVEDVCDVKGMHQTIFYGDYGKELRAFCQLLNIPIET